MPRFCTGILAGIAIILSLSVWYLHPLEERKPFKNLEGNGVENAMRSFVGYPWEKEEHEVEEGVRRFAGDVEDDKRHPSTKASNPVAQRFVERNRRVEEFCSKRRPGGNSTLDDNFMYYSKKYQLMMCLVPKTGSTTTKQTIMVLEVNKRLPSSYKALQKYLIAHLVYGDEYYRNLLVSPVVTRVMSARHPLRRLVSLYIDRWRVRSLPIPWSNYTHEYREHIGVKDDRQPVKFQEYLEIIVYLRKLRGRSLLNPHCRPSVTMCDPCSVSFDYIIETETLSEDMAYLSETLSIPGINPKLHLHKHSSAKGPDYYDYYRTLPPSLLKNIYEVYEEDFQFFGYTLPDFYKEAIEAA